MVIGGGEKLLLETALNELAKVVEQVSPDLDGTWRNFLGGFGRSCLHRLRVRGLRMPVGRR